MKLPKLEVLNLSEAQFEFKCLEGYKNEEKWLTHWEKVWPYCKAWYVSEGLLRRPSYFTCLSAIKSFMPELETLYSSLVEKTGGSDLASRFLSLYCPPPYMAGCSQAVWDKDELFLVKNYDYSPQLFENTMMYTNWLKPVIGILDCAWGVLDGMNGNGLIASLTFGGKKEIGDGFGAPLILRYLLETSNTVEEAKIKIKIVPCHMSYNITLLDATWAYCQVFLRPGTPAIFKDDPVSTNHQDFIDWIQYAEFSKTVERYNFLKKILMDKNISSPQFIQSFLNKPLFNNNFKNQFGTLYTIVYRPQLLSIDMIWKEFALQQSFNDFKEINTNIIIK